MWMTTWPDEMSDELTSTLSLALEVMRCGAEHVLDPLGARANARARVSMVHCVTEEGQLFKPSGASLLCPIDDLIRWVER
jgi:hypothetical protein